MSSLWLLLWLVSLTQWRRCKVCPLDTILKELIIDCLIGTSLMMVTVTVFMNSNFRKIIIIIMFIVMMAVVISIMSIIRYQMQSQTTIRHTTACQCSGRVICKGYASLLSWFSLWSFSSTSLPWSGAVSLPAAFMSSSHCLLRTVHCVLESIGAQQVQWCAKEQSRRCSPPLFP